MDKIVHRKLSPAFSVFALLCLAPFRALAQSPDLGLGFVEPLGLPTAGAIDPHTMLTNLVGYALTFVSIIAVAMIMYGGFVLMVSLGNDDLIAKGRGTIISGIIGLILVSASYAIANLVINTTSNVLAGGF